MLPGSLLCRAILASTVYSINKINLNFLALFPVIQSWLRALAVDILELPLWDVKIPPLFLFGVTVYATRAADD